MRYEAEGVCGLEKCNTMISLMNELQIFQATSNQDGTFNFTEACDYYYFANLTKEQVLALAQELIDLANGVSE